MKKKFFIIIILNIKQNYFYFENNFAGKEIKSIKSQEKNKIAKEIESRMNDLFLHLVNPKSPKDISMLSATGLSRYCGKKYYIQKNNLDNRIIQEAGTGINELCSKDNTVLFDFITPRIGYLKEKIRTFYQKESQFLTEYHFLQFIEAILAGHSTQDALHNNHDIQQNEISLKSPNIIELLIRKKNTTTPDQETFFDTTADDLLLKTFIVNMHNKIEIDRVINRIENATGRKPCLLTISSYLESDFGTNEKLNTFGEMTPDRDTYKKILFTKNTYPHNNESSYQMMHRNIPFHSTPDNMYITIIPRIKNNITEYYTIIDNKIIPLKKYIQSIQNKDFLCISVLPTSQITWLLK
jgi:hypothetical protein